MVYFSQLKNNCIYDSNKECIGNLIDLVFKDGKEYAEITHIILQDENKYKKKISWDFVKEFKEKKEKNNKIITIYLNSPIDDITQFFLKKKESLVGSILDRQVIDVNGVKVVRVNDIILGKVGRTFSIVGVGVGSTSFVKRLGIRGFTNLTSTKEQIIPWKSVEILEAEFRDLHLKVQKDKIADLHPEDIADIMEDLSHSERILIFNSLNERKAAKTLIEAEEEVQDSVLKNFKIKKIKDLLENIPTDQAADIISLMPDSKAAEILKTMGKDDAAKIRKILNYVPESIGSIMKTEFIAIPKDYTVQKTINKLRKIKTPTATTYHMYVVDKKQLIGVLSARGLLMANPKRKIADIMKKEIIYIKDNSPKETAARLMARYDLFVLPVVDKENKLRGIVKADDILDDYIPERLQREKFLPLKLRKQ